jgi:hypothetical protein
MLIQHIKMERNIFMTLITAELKSNRISKSDMIVKIKHNEVISSIGSQKELTIFK